MCGSLLSISQWKDIRLIDKHLRIALLSTGVQLLLDRVWICGVGLDNNRILLGDVWILPPLQRLLPHGPRLPAAAALPRKAPGRPRH